MGGDPFRHVQVGDPPGVPVVVWNAILDAIRKIVGATIATRGGKQFDPEKATILVRNDSGADRACFDVLGIDTPLVSPVGGTGYLDEFAARLAVSGITPAAGHARRFCVLQEALASGAIGRAIIAGTTIARVNATTSATGTFVKAGAGVTTALVQDASGIGEVLWAESGTGNGKYAVVRIGSPDTSGGTAAAAGSLLKYVSSDTYHMLAYWSKISPDQITGNNGASADGNIVACPFTMPGCTIDRLATIVNNAGMAGEKMRLGIYDSGSDLLPDALVVDSGEIDADSTGPKESGAISATLESGSLYWAVVRFNNDTASATQIQGIQGPADANISNHVNVFGIDRSDFLGGVFSVIPAYVRIGLEVTGLGALAALPATFPGGATWINLGLTTGLGNAPPMILARLSA